MLSDRGIIDEGCCEPEFPAMAQGDVYSFSRSLCFHLTSPLKRCEVQDHISFWLSSPGAVTTIRPDLHSVLIDELTFVFADKIQYRGERSFELVQCLLVLMLNYSRH